jgi:hypothetical protein
MKHRPIDKALKELERKADLIGYIIDENEEYIFVCSVVSDMDFGIIPDFDTKQKVFHILEGLYEEVKMDFRSMMLRLVLEGCE